MVRNTLIVAIFLLLTISCASTKQNITDITTWNTQTAESVREVAKNILETWPTYAGVIYGALGDKIVSDLPNATIAAMMELNKMSDIYASGEITDYQLGYSLGLWIRTSFELIQESIKQYTPDILELLPMLL